MTIEPLKYFVVGLTHIDLAWKKDREEHEEILEAATVRLLDVLDTHPDFTYIIEQASHYRTLARTRPDLIARLRQYVTEDRVEFVGGLASTLETNGPSGESFVRNQLLGLACVAELFGARVRTGYLIDTFGLHPQVPQILRQFGLKTLLANRFGGLLEKDTFIAVGLDGSRLLVAGRDVNSSYVAWDRIFFGFVQENKHIKALFDTAESATAEGPFLVMPYTEYDGIASTYIDKLLDRQKQRHGNSWGFATAARFFDALERHPVAWPAYDGDLNPEFTGTFGLRVGIRTLHRTAENLLLDSEKWASLLGLDTWRAGVTDAWWKMAFAQSHDVFSGSHPTTVYRDTMAQLAQAEAEGSALLERCAAALDPSHGDGAPAIIALNHLPFERDATVTTRLPERLRSANVTGVLDGEDEVPFEKEGQTVTFRSTFPGISAKRFALRVGSSATAPTAEIRSLAAPAHLQTASIGNAQLRVTADLVHGLQIRLADTDGGPDHIVNAELVVQEDRGNFQIEQFVGSEVSSRVGLTAIARPSVSSLKETLSVRGQFPALWMTDPKPLDWEMSCVVYPGKPQIDLFVKLHWRGNAARVRLKVSTGLETSTGFFEVPFGAVRRLPYQTRRTARGEWPVHRWVAVEEEGQGVALINRGTMGAQVMGGALSTTLLRSPTTEYAGMVSDDTSSQHGEHDFEFSILPYKGSWKDGRCIELAQEINSPIYCTEAQGAAAVLEGSHLTLGPSTIVLSCVKSPEDETAGELIVRFYEATGQRTEVELLVKGAQTAWLSDLAETRGDVLPCVEGRISLSVDAFQITTLRVLRS